MKKQMELMKLMRLINLKINEVNNKWNIENLILSVAQRNVW